MNDDKYALVEKIVKDIHNVLSKTAELYAFDIVPVDSNFRNKSPVLCVENCLGLESWCVKHVYMYCFSEIKDKYGMNSQRKQKKITTLDSERLVKLLNVTLLINPDVTTLWNKRREIVQMLLLDKVSELQFSQLVLSRKPKCNDAFAYRRWLLGALLLSDNVQANLLENLINSELRICDETSDKSPNNYHSWSHRLWVVNNMKDVLKQFDMNSLYIKEYIFSEKCISSHVSDYSCFHYRQFCIKNICSLVNSSWKSFENSIDINLRKVLVTLIASNLPKDGTIQASEDDLVSYSEENLVNLLLSCNVKNCNCTVNNVALCRKLEVICHELVLNNELIRFYQSHETLWYHRRFILHELIAMMYDHFNLFRNNGILVKKNCKHCSLNDMRQKQAKISRYDSNCIYNSVLFQVILTHENKFIEERQTDGDNYAGRHEKYLKFVEGLNNVM
ncbi:protein prenyltransferase alpha subunit repeat-containing protein 1 [Colias croceus]|uniref:protein prenyltransferase alpha subunit repeat-containing protein 1 n=1 Tax=Colias crocea TaxID=72248 RepID=UPI001E27FDA0|nr:protein prenyltransferase alpha subunit repeat-containing protein 1 [Colias croceus]